MMLDHRGRNGRNASSNLLLIALITLAGAIMITASHPESTLGTRYNQVAPEQSPKAGEQRRTSRGDSKAIAISFCGKNAYLEILEQYRIRVQTEMVVNFHDIDAILTAAVASSKVFRDILTEKIARTIKEATVLNDKTHVVLLSLPAIAKHDYVKVTGKLADAKKLCTSVDGRVGQVLTYPVPSRSNDTTPDPAIKELMTKYKISIQPFNLIGSHTLKTVTETDTGQVVAILADNVSEPDALASVVIKLNTDGTLTLNKIPDTADHIFLCQIPRDNFLSSRSAYRHFQSVAKTAGKHSGDLETMAHRLSEFFKGATEAPVDTVWQLPVPTELANLSDLLEELTEPLNFNDPEFDLLVALKQYNVAVEQLAKALHFTLSGWLQITLPSNSLVPLNKELQAFPGPIDDIIQINTGAGGKYMLAAADIKDPLITTVFRIWPFADLESHKIYVDKYLVVEGSISFTTNEIPIARECVHDTLYGRICPAPVTGRNERKYACGSFITGGSSQLNEDETACDTAVPINGAYVVAGSCEQDKSDTSMLVVLKPSLLDFHCPDLGVISTKVPTGQYETPVVCSITSKGQTIYNTATKFRHVAANMTLLDKIKDASKILMHNDEHTEQLEKILISAGIPVTTLSLLAILIAICKLQNFDWSSCCRRRGAADAPAQVSNRYAPGAPTDSKIEMTERFSYTAAPSYSSRRPLRTYDADDLTISRLALH